jgi:hypothetical protein
MPYYRFTIARAAVRRVHNVSASQILDNKDDYYCNWPVKGLPNQPDFRQKHHIPGACGPGGSY